MRNVQWFSMPWALDVAEYHLYAITFCAAPWVLRNGGHITVDLLLQQLNATATKQFKHLAHLIGAAVCLILLYYACKVLWASYSAQTLVYKALIIPEWWLFVLPPLSFLLMLLVFLHWLLRPPEAATTATTANDPDGL